MFDLIEYWHNTIIEVGKWTIQQQRSPPKPMITTKSQQQTVQALRTILQQKSEEV